MMSQRLRAGLVLLFVFAAGALTGIVFERHHQSPAPAAMSLQQEHAAAMAELREVLELDGDQIEQIHAIFARRQEVVEQIWEHFRPEVHEAMRQVHLEMAALLRPEQLERYHDWLARRREQHLLRQRDDRAREQAPLHPHAH